MIAVLAVMHGGRCVGVTVHRAGEHPISLEEHKAIACRLFEEGVMNVQITAEQLVEKMQKAIRSGDPAAMAALYTEDALLHEGSEVYQGREAIKESYAGMLRAFPDANPEFWNIMTCGETFIYEGIQRATHMGALATPEGEIAPTGRRIEFRFAFIAEMSPQGLIQGDRTYFDSALMMQQLGLG